ncbi:MAG: type VI secretion system protein TssA [Acidobacteria bacterium]|nr:type VI secretion system protein TssA [Acidobacteriota bacterium]
MPLREDILQPIPGDNPSGRSLRYDALYDEIREARREEEDLAQGEWQTERKVADFGKVLKLSSEAIATRSKDLQLAFWATEALLRLEGFPGLLSGIKLNHSLVEQFWDTLFPEDDEDDGLELRAAPLNQLGLSLAEAVRFTAIVREGYHLFDYRESRLVGTEESAKSKEEKKARDAKIAAGKVTPEQFADAFEASPKAYYVQMEGALDGCLESLDGLGKLCDEKFGDEAPGFSALRDSLTEVRHQVHQFLEKKRELEPDPVEEVPEEVAEGEEAGAGEPGDAAAGGGVKKVVAAASLVIPPGAGEPADRQEIVAAIANAAATLRKKNPTSPAAYLMLRGLRWGELREAAVAGDASALQPPPIELRRRLKALALEGRWEELLEDCERTLALPYGRAWLDLQRFAVEACAGLGPSYHLVARAICAQLATLLADVPDIVQLTLLDETPVASLETRAWLRELSGGLTEQAPLDLRALALASQAAAVEEPESEPEPEPEPAPEPEPIAADGEPTGEAGEASEGQEGADGASMDEPSAPKPEPPPPPKPAPKPPPRPRPVAAPVRAHVPPPPFPRDAKPLEIDYAWHPGWRKKDTADAFELAQKALKAGKQQEALEVLFADLEKQRSGRARFQRQLQIAEILIGADKKSVAQPLLNDIRASIDQHQLHGWEERDMVVHALIVIYHHCEAVTGDKKAPAEIYDRIVRLDPSRALEL